jgi:hypothetical protein
VHPAETENLQRQRAKAALDAQVTQTLRTRSDGEEHDWVHVAIDRFTGQVLENSSKQ